MKEEMFFFKTERKALVFSLIQVFLSVLFFLIFFIRGFDYEYETLWAYCTSGIIRCLVYFPLEILFRMVFRFDEFKISTLIFCLILLSGTVIPFVLSVRKKMKFPFRMILLSIFALCSFVWNAIGIIFYSYDRTNAKIIIDADTALKENIDIEDDDEFTLCELLSIRKAEEIRAALEEFYNDNGHYPRSLELLVPKYMKKIPRTDVWWFYTFPFARYGEFSYLLDNCNPNYMEWDYSEGKRVLKMEDKDIQNYYLHFRYNFDEDYVTFSDGKWSYHYH